MVFVHTGHVNFNFNKCSLITEYCFQLSRRLKWSESLLVRFPLPKIFHSPTGGISPLKNTGGKSMYITSKTSEGGNIFLRKYITSRSVIENNTTSKRNASSRCSPTISAGGRRGAEKCAMLAKREEDLHFLNF